MAKCTESTETNKIINCIVFNYQIYLNTSKFHVFVWQILKTLYKTPLYKYLASVKFKISNKMQSLYSVG